MKGWRDRERERERESVEKQFLCRAQTALLTLSVITKSHTQLQGLLPSLPSNVELGFDPARRLPIKTPKVAGLLLFYNG